MTYYILRESLNDSKWVSDTICLSMIKALRLQRKIIRYSSKCYKPVRGKKYKYECDDYNLEIIKK